jgi:general secretion pathway protein E/type IV pilus assembly protein PilB
MMTQDPTATSPGRGDVLDILLQNGSISPVQAEQARRRMNRAQVSSHQALVDLKLCSQATIYQALAEGSGLQFTPLTEVKIDESIKETIPAKVALHYHFVPLKLDKKTLTAAFATPPSVNDKEALRLLLGLRLQPLIATPIEINQTLKSLYGMGAEIVMQLRQNRAPQQRSGEAFYDEEEELSHADDDDSSATIAHLVNQILQEALEADATDIHIEPFEDSCRVRYRVDGILRDIPVPDHLHELHDAITSRLKVMANLNIAERRLPHDGRMRVRIESDEFDLRVSILPTRFGETLCLRILNRRTSFLDINCLGLAPKQLALLNKLIDLPHGIILVTGPTGSGKTTTLYAALARVRDQNTGRKIITVEDPVEYVMKGISQIQIRSDIGLTFAGGLRSILRHDPDIVLVGEIRDTETAEIAIRSALTGHLVLSTLHTNDSVGAINRLVDMRIEPFLVASSLMASIAQRLVRRICPHCKVEDQHIPKHLRREIALSQEIAEDQVRTWHSEGCSECGFSGYRGRFAIFEIFILDERIQDMVSARASTSDLRHTAKARGMYTLRDDGWRKVIQGMTSIEEVNRLTSTFQLSYDLPEDGEG